MGFGQSWRMFVRALKLSYDHIGKVMVTNLIWFGLGFAPFLAFSYLPFQNDIFFIISIVATVVTLGGATAGVQYRMNQIIRGEEASLQDFWIGFKSFFVKATVLLVIAVLGFVILVFNIWFSQNYPSTLFLILSGLWIWGIVYWYSVQQFALPFLVNQKTGVFLVIKRAALLTLDNPLASFLLLVFSLVIIVLSALLAAPLLIFVASFLALLQNSFYHEMMLKYDGADQDDSAESEGEDKA